MDQQVDRKWIFIILILVGCVNENLAQTGYRCFTCTSNANDLTCLNDPSHVTSGSSSVPCDQENGEFGWCQIVRQEYSDIPGSIVNFNRMCLKTEPTLYDVVITDNAHTFYYRTCRTHLCNSGDGLESSDSGADLGAGAGAGTMIRVNPEYSLSTSIHSTCTLILYLIFTAILITFNFLQSH